MSIKSRKVIFRVTEKFYEEHIEQHRKAGGFKTLSSYLRTVHQQVSDGGHNPAPPIDPTLMNKFCTELHRLNTNFRQANISVLNAASVPDKQVFIQLTSKADQILKAIDRGIRKK